MFDGSVDAEDEEHVDCDDCGAKEDCDCTLVCVAFGDGVLRVADDNDRSTDPRGMPTFRPYPCNSGFISRLFIRFPVVHRYILS